MTTKPSLCKHGLAVNHPRLYRIWARMKYRCYNANSQDYNHYGGRGITAHEEWRNSSVAFCLWALSNGYENGLEIDRKNNDEGYNPENCRWVTRSQNMRNTRHNRLLTVDGITHCLKEWSDQLCLNPSLIRMWVHRNGEAYAITKISDILKNGYSKTVHPHTVLIPVNNDKKSQGEWSRITGVPQCTISSWVVKKGVEYASMRIKQKLEEINCR